MNDQATTRKLTKKQKKGLAFRERKGKRKETDVLDELAVPVDDLPVERIDEAEDEPREEEPRAQSAKHDSTSKKRKRTNSDTGVAATSEKPKKHKKQNVEHNEEEASEKTQEIKKKADGEKIRYILFVGNLKYTTSIQAIREHFSKCDPPPQVRLLTPKLKTPGKPMPKSKGCAFLEFSHKNALQQGLKLHGSNLEGRCINVELTAGGGGKGENRVEKVKARNKQLHEERKLRSEKKIEDGDEEDIEAISRPQRHSTTSGLENNISKRRTWSIPEDGEKSGHGGVKKRGKKKPGKSWGTGANAIAFE